MNIAMLKSLRLYKSLSVLIFLFATVVVAQVSERVLSVNVGEGKENEPLSVQVQLATSGSVTQVLLAYRHFGSSEFKQVEMTTSGNTASVTIPGLQVTPPSLEYYFLLKVQGKDTAETYPKENPEGHPFQIQINAAAREKAIVFLSPEPGANVRTEELFISISLAGVSSSVNKKASKLLIDNQDVTASAGITDELITFSPENLKPPLAEGPHTISVELYSNDGKLFTSSSVNFAEITAEEAAATKINYNVSAEVESRNETINSASTPYNRASLNLSSDYGPVRLNGRFYLTNEDQDDRQPQNRYYIEGLVASWLKVGYGDAYPTFPNLIMSGKRLRGLNTSLHLGFFNLDFAKGDVIRKINGDTVKTFLKGDTLNNQGGGSPFGPYDSTVSADSQRFATFRYGTYKRELTVIRPSFGSRDNFQWGFSYLRAKDDTSSISYGIRPQENVALGTDMIFALDNHRFEITAQGAASIINNDIASGNLSDDQIDSLYKFKTGALASSADTTDVIKKRKDLKDLREKISPYITVNQNLVPLSTDKLTSVMAYEGAMSLNYFNNYLKASYMFRGNQYRSFGQTFLRNDVKGYNIFDRIRLMENQFFFSLGIEQLTDNTDDSKIATTTFSNDNFTLSYYPRINFPNVTVGYGFNKNSNGLISTDTTVTDSAAHVHAINLFSSQVEGKTDRFYVQLNYSFTAGLQHNAMLNISTSSTADETFHHIDTKNTVLSGMVTTTWSRLMQTTGGTTLNFNQLPTLDPTDSLKQRFILYDFNYTTFLFNVRYLMMEDKLQLSGTFSPTFGDFSRMMWSADADYLLIKDVHAVFLFSLLQNSGAPTDIIGSLMLKYNM